MSFSKNDRLQRQYTLVKFIPEEGKDSGKIEIEIVPSTWIDYEKNSRKFVTRFMPKPYTKMKTQKLYKMVEDLEESLDDWPTFEIEIRGHAGNVFFQTLK